MWFVNLFVSAATNYATSDNTLGAIIVGVLAALIFLVVWHNGRIKGGKSGVEPWHLICGGMVGVLIFAAVALSGVVWQMRQSKVAAATNNNLAPRATEFDVFSGRQFTPEKTSYKQPSGSVLIASRYYSAKNKEEVAGFLDKISGTINKTGDEMLLLTEKVINQSPWDRPGENIEPFIQQMDVVITKAAQIHATFYDEMLANEREYRVEMNAILFPQEPFINFQDTAKAFRNGLSVWNQMRDKSEGAERQELLNLVMSSRMSFGHARDLFVKWLSRRQEIIDQTRIALRS